jgi:DNA-binding NarL/FixJ family response regulator
MAERCGRGLALTGGCAAPQHPAAAPGRSGCPSRAGPTQRMVLPVVFAAAVAPWSLRSRPASGIRAYIAIPSQQHPLIVASWDRAVLRYLAGTMSTLNMSVWVISRSQSCTPMTTGTLKPWIEMVSITALYRLRSGTQGSELAATVRIALIRRPALKTIETERAVARASQTSVSGAGRGNQKGFLHPAYPRHGKLGFRRQDRRGRLPGMTVRLLILVQEGTFADALATKLEAEPDLEVAAAWHASIPSPEVLTGSRADVMLLDGDLPGNAAFGLCEELSLSGEAPYVVIISDSSDPRRIIRGLEAGAIGWVREDESFDRLIAVIRGAVRGETWLPRSDTGEVLRLLLHRGNMGNDSVSELLTGLTQREREVLVRLAEGAGRRDTAEHLHMSPNMVRTHLQNLMAKLGVHSALEAVALTRSHLAAHARRTRGGHYPPDSGGNRRADGR